MFPSLQTRRTSSLLPPFLFLSVLLLLIFPHLLLISRASFLTNNGGNETDRISLLAMKSRITHDPLGFTSSWNDSRHFCNWAGITCGNLHRRVTQINLMSLGLKGTLPPHIGNLTFLAGINLENNDFHGKIPPEIGGLVRLKHLNLSNNSFSGEIPGNVSRCYNLVILRLGFNGFSGFIPFQLGFLPKLEKFQLHHNNFTGTIPETLGNLSSVSTISLAVNDLEGRIPDSLGRLSKLRFLGLGFNRLLGMIPPTIFNISSLESLSLRYNKLHGNLPVDLGFALPNLKVLNIGGNPFSGSLPMSLSNVSSLVELDVSGSNFVGKVSIDFGGLVNLWVLHLGSNSLDGDLDFLNSLSRCKSLRNLDLSHNQFGGVLWPNSLANLSSSLVLLRLNGNRLSGSIPHEIGKFLNLKELQLQNNKLNGSIPNEIGELKMLRLLDLSENELSGFIPFSLANVTRLYSLHLENNSLIGNIPTLRNLVYLQEMDLSQNHLNGTIPGGITSLSSLTISLNLAHNNLSGPLPPEVGSLKNLGYLDISENMLSGEIPSSIGCCLALERLNMRGNNFVGSIPPSFRSLRELRELDLSRNNLSGQIPDYFQGMLLEYLNLSFNHFVGELPREGIFRNASAISVVGNDELCGGIPALELPTCVETKTKKKESFHSLKLIIPLFSGLLGLVLIMSLLVVNRLWKTKREGSLDFPSTRSLILRLTYESLLTATEGFSSANLIGTGRFSSIYKGILDPDETIVAIKVLNLHQRGASKSFLSECEAWRSIRHRNLVKLITAFSGSDFQGNEVKALVYEFMPNGSLKSRMHLSFAREEEQEITSDSRILSLSQRLDIAIDVASAIDYLHNHCDKQIIHCDLKPSNILLDDEMTARVGDFGLARFIQEATTSKSHQNHESSSLDMKGTVGYAAPEYGMGSKVTPYGDIYSYGILLLEMFTGKSPVDDMFREGSTNLHTFAKAALPERINDILDPALLPIEEEEEENEGTVMEIGSMVKAKVDQMQECLISIIGIGVACSEESPRERMDIGDAVKELQLIRDILIASGMNYSSISGSTRFGGSSSRSVTINWQNVL